MARPSLVPRVWGRGSSLTELQLDANQSSSTNITGTDSSEQTGIRYHNIISILRSCVVCLKSKVLRQKGDKSALAMPFRF